MMAKQKEKNTHVNDGFWKKREHKLRIHLKKNEMEIISIKMLFFLGDYVCEI